jgi:hypothetical protein
MFPPELEAGWFATLVLVKPIASSCRESRAGPNALKTAQIDFHTKGRRSLR